MKHLIYLSFILLFNSCVDQKSRNFDYIIFNQTDKNVKILPFGTRTIEGNLYSKAVKAEPIHIAPNSNYKITRMNGLGGTMGFVFYSITGVDSVRIIFNNTKVKIDSKISTHFSKFSIFQGDSNHQHFITEDDYKSAEDCNADCQ